MWYVRNMIFDFRVQHECRAPFAEPDPFHLTATENIPHLIRSYVDDHGRFMFREFQHQFLTDINCAIGHIYRLGKNPPQLKRVTSTEMYNKHGHCSACAIEKEAEFPGQCPTCAVTVSQTKVLSFSSLTRGNSSMERRRRQWFYA